MRACVGRSSDPEAWLELHERFGRRIESRLICHCYGVGIVLLHDEPTELCQELMIRWLTSSRPFCGQTEDEFWTFVNTSVRNLSLDVARRRRAKRRCRQPPVPIGSDGVCRTRRVCRVLHSREPSPEQRLLRQELHLQVMRDAARIFPGLPRHVDALVSVLCVGLTSREAAAELGDALSPSQIDYAVDKLRRRSDLPDALFVRRRLGERRSPCFKHALPPAGVIRFSLGDGPC